MFIVFLSTYVPIFKTLALVQSSKNVKIQFEYKVSDRFFVKTKNIEKIRSRSDPQVNDAS